jgi:hypothetical protein
MKRKRYSKEFKARVALEAIKGQKTANELASEYDWGFRVVSTRLGAKPRQTWAAAISRNLACAYAPEGWLGCPEMARTRLGSGIARDL